MSIKIKLLNIESTLRDVTNRFNTGANANLRKVSVDLKRELVSATPIDTGNARAHWNNSIKKDSVEIVNDTPYIEALNNGHSKQAPSHYIEAIALKYGTPLGVIAELRN